MATATKKSMDMTNGPVLKNLFIIAMPLALAGVLQLLFNAAKRTFAQREKENHKKD